MGTPCMFVLEWRVSATLALYLQLMKSTHLLSRKIVIWPSWLFSTEAVRRRRGMSAALSEMKYGEKRALGAAHQRRHLVKLHGCRNGCLSTRHILDRCQHGEAKPQIGRLDQQRQKIKATASRRINRPEARLRPGGTWPISCIQRQACC